MSLHTGSEKSVVFVEQHLVILALYMSMDKTRFTLQIQQQNGFCLNQVEGSFFLFIQKYGA